jgi:hypothetical protein
MIFLSYFLASLVSFIGLPVGMFLAHVSPEEMPTGRKLFPLLQGIILVAIFAIAIKIFVGNFYARLPLYALAILLANLRLRPSIAYLLLGALFFLSSLQTNAFIAVAALIFIYGLPAGGLFKVASKTEAAIFALKNLHFILVTIALYLIPAAV